MGEWAGATQALVEGFADDATLVPTLRGWGVIRQGGRCSRRHCGTFVCSSCLWATATAAAAVAAAAAAATGILGATAEARHGGAEAQTPLLGEPANCWGSQMSEWPCCPQKRCLMVFSQGRHMVRCPRGIAFTRCSNPEAQRPASPLSPACLSVSAQFLWLVVWTPGSRTQGTPGLSGLSQAGSHSAWERRPALGHMPQKGRLSRHHLGPGAGSAGGSRA